MEAETPSDEAATSRGAAAGGRASSPTSGDSDRYRRFIASILATAVEGILTIDEQGTIEAVNPAAQRMFGYTAEELIGANVSVLMPPPWRDEHDGYLEHYRRTRERHIIGIGREVRGRRRDGSTFPLELSVSEVEWENERRFVGIVRDVSDRKAMEEALRRERDFADEVIDTAPAIVLVLDPRGRIVRFNRFFAGMTGRRLDEVRGADWFETFLPPADRPRIRDLFARIVAGEGVQGSVNAVVAAGGTLRQIEWYSTVLRHDRRVHGVLSIGLDVTERQRLEEQFLQAQRLEAVGRLAGGIAHDFNNLLMGVVGGCRMAADTLADNHPARPLLADMGAAAERGVGLTRQLLTFSRRETINPRPIDLNETVRRVLGMAGHLLGEDIAIATELCAGGTPILADPGQIEQVLLNLVVNARDAMPGGGSLRISTGEQVLGADPAGHPQSRAGRYVVLEVQDTGIGMTAETRARIFEPFFTTKGPDQGTGLGLSTVFGIVTRIGGHIQVQSEPGAGTTFTVLLPRSEREPEHPAHAPAPASTSPPVPDGTVVLLVEDDRLVRRTVQYALEARGVRVLVASNATEAMELAGANRDIDLLLTDVVLPDLGGPEIAGRVCELHPHLPVLFMSAHSNEHLVDSGRLRPGAPSLEKPFTDDELWARIREVLARDPRR